MNSPRLRAKRRTRCWIRQREGARQLLSAADGYEGVASALDGYVAYYEDESTPVDQAAEAALAQEVDVPRIARHAAGRSSVGFSMRRRPKTVRRYAPSSENNRSDSKSRQRGNAHEPAVSARSTHTVGRCSVRAIPRRAPEARGHGPALRCGVDGQHRARDATGRSTRAPPHRTLCASPPASPSRRRRLGCVVGGSRLRWCRQAIRPSV